MALLRWPLLVAARAEQMGNGDMVTPEMSEWPSSFKIMLRSHVAIALRAYILKNRGKSGLDGLFGTFQARARRLVTLHTWFDAKTPQQYGYTRIREPPKQAPALDVHNDPWNSRCCAL